MVTNTPAPTPTMSPEEREEQEPSTPPPPPTPTPAPTDPADAPSETDLLPPIPTSVDFCYGLNRWEDGPEFFKYEPGCLYLYEKTAHETCGVTATAWHSSEFVTADKQVCLQREYAQVGDYIHRISLGHDCLADANNNRKEYVECKRADQDRTTSVIEGLFTSQRMIMAVAEQNAAVVQAEKRVNTCLEGVEKEFPDIDFNASRTVYWLDGMTVPFPPFRRAWAERDSQRLEKVIEYTDRIHFCAEKAGYYAALHGNFVAELIRLSGLDPSPVEAMTLTGLAEYRVTAGPSQFAPRFRQ